jgi:type II secretory pathway pseudopilin PulG
MTVIKDAAVPHQTFEVTMSILTVVIAIIVICLYPNFENGINRRKQRRLMGDFRVLESALESYHSDFNLYPQGNTTVESIREELEPYLETDLPVKDDWGNQYVYRSDGRNSYTIMSFGKDREQDAPEIYKGPVYTFTNDIVFSNGNYITIQDSCCLID